jgi:membrane protease YdiL (CAAX protease family)
VGCVVVDSGNTGLLDHPCWDIGICWRLDFLPALVAAFAGCLGWRLLSFATTALFILVFRLNFRSLNQSWIISFWLAVAIIDPWLEEGYWRGLLMDSASGWPGWLIVMYTTFWFGLSHPLLLGVNVKALSGLPGFIGTVFTGAIWSIVYLKTRSLRWPIFSHFVADLLSVSIIVFLNRAVLAS